MELMQEFVFGLWHLWKNRNDLIFKGVTHQPLDILGLWMRNMGEYREAGRQRTKGDQPTVGLSSPAPAGRTGQWKKPGFGTIKAAGGTGGRPCHSAAAAEMLAIRNALDFCVRLGFNSMAIELDAKNIIQMIRNETTPDCNLECTLGDIVTLARGLESVTFDFVSRESNRAAHSVAKYVFLEGKDFVWDHIGPDFLFNILAQDVNLSIRL
ncbi:unnamed protein product [Malus baccata var. baccata]